ncbi:MAG TPA: hypothetical protein VF245_12750 [Solirubrobacterales bacterium]
MATIAEKLATLAVTDNLNRNENPLAGEWKLLKPGVKTGRANNTAGEEGYSADSLFTAGEDDAYWSKTSYAVGADAVAALCRITRLPTTAERQIGLWVLRSKATPETTQSGYRLRAEWLSGKKIKFVLEKWVAGVMSELKKTEVETYGVGSRIAIVVSGGKVYFFASKEKESAFEQVLEAEDVTYTEGYSGIWGKGSGEFRAMNFATGNLELEEVAGVIKPNPATATASRAEPAIAMNPEWVVATATASMAGGSEVAGGAMPSPTDHKRGLPLPFPSILANPGRVGPSRFSASDRKTLGLD